MSDPLVVQVRRHFQAYLEGQLALRALYHWLATEVIATDAERLDPAVQQALGHTVLTIYEFQAGHRTEDDIRCAIRAAFLEQREALSSADSVRRSPTGVR